MKKHHPRFFDGVLKSFERKIRNSPEQKLRKKISGIMNNFFQLFNIISLFYFGISFDVDNCCVETDL